MRRTHLIVREVTSDGDKFSVSVSVPYIAVHRRAKKASSRPNIIASKCCHGIYASFVRQPNVVLPASKVAQPANSDSK